MAKVHSYEKAYLWMGAVILVLFLFALLYASVVRGIHLPGQVSREYLEPDEVLQTPPFDSLGVRQVGPDKYQAVMVGRVWTFTPNEIRVPAGAEVTFLATTLDVIHGMKVEGSRLNMMLIPGQISRTTYTFDEPGEYLLICHEYCGIGHHTMAGKVIVE